MFFSACHLHPTLFPYFFQLSTEIPMKLFECFLVFAEWALMKFLSYVSTVFFVKQVALSHQLEGIKY